MFDSEIYDQLQAMILEDGRAILGGAETISELQEIAEELGL